ncbi:hypothetical protein ACFWIX_14580 [Pseudarthrobacter sp. NPDC058362]|uniref:hypothetical protein n=1 Tax=Pseudarthrobacter sp. NPDC058362 TaxID=3346458 RepID=UPI0036697964
MNPHAARVLDTVDQILLEAGQEGASDLRSALISMGALAEMPVPAPGPQLAALLSGTSVHTSPVHTTRREALAREAAVRQEAARKGARFRSDELARRRALRRNRSAVVGLTVMAGMGLGVTSVAASLPAATDNHATVQQLLEDWSPHWTIEAPSAAEDYAPMQEPAVSVEPKAAEAPEAATAAPEQGANPAAGPGQPGTAGNGKSQALLNAGGPTAAGMPSSTPAGDGGRAAEAGGKPAGPEEAEAAKPAEQESAKAGSSGTGQKASPGARWLKKFGQ